MNIKEIYSSEGSTFGETIAVWAESIGIEHFKIDLKQEEKIDEIQGLILFHETHDIVRAHQEVISIFEQKQRAISKIDVNGTLMVAVSNFSLWMERNKCKSILVVGSDELLKNPNLERFLEKLKTA